MHFTELLIFMFCTRKNYIVNGFIERFDLVETFNTLVFNRFRKNYENILRMVRKKQVFFVPMYYFGDEIKINIIRLANKVKMKWTLDRGLNNSSD